MATDKPHQQTEWYAILSDEEKLKVDEYTEKWPNNSINVKIPFNTFIWGKSPENSYYWNRRSIDMALELKGKPSPSMGVNTKPADRIEYKGRLIYFEYETPNEIIEEVKLKLK